MSLLILLPCFFDYNFIPSCFNYNQLKPIAEFYLFRKTRNSLEKWPLNLWWISNKTLIKVGNFTKAATFKSFLHQGHKINFCLQCFFCFYYFHETYINRSFLGLHKNINCAFPLTKNGIIAEMLEGGSILCRFSMVWFWFLRRFVQTGFIF